MLIFIVMRSSFLIERDSGSNRAMRITNRATYLAQSEGILSELGIVPDQHEVLRFPDPAHTKDMLASLTPKVTFEKLLPVYGYVFIKYGPVGGSAEFLGS